jgi:hypothetical protein
LPSNSVHAASAPIRNAVPRSFRHITDLPKPFDGPVAVDTMGLLFTKG